MIDHTVASFAVLFWQDSESVAEDSGTEAGSVVEGQSDTGITYIYCYSFTKLAIDEVTLM